MHLRQMLAQLGGVAWREGYTACMYTLCFGCLRSTVCSLAWAAVLDDVVALLQQAKAEANSYVCWGAAFSL